MIDMELDIESGVAEITVHKKLEEADFETLAPHVDKLIEQKGKMRGVLVNLGDFHGWENLHAVLTHLRFVKDHHEFIKRLAIVGDKRWQEVVPHVVKLFVDAEPRHFNSDAIDEARAWVREE